MSQRTVQVHCRNNDKSYNLDINLSSVVSILSGVN